MEAVQSEVSGSEAEDDDLIPHNEFNDVVDELSGPLTAPQSPISASFGRQEKAKECQDFRKGL